jgi:hypothetical protein
MDALNSAVPVEPGSADGPSRPASRTCSDCSSPITRQSKTGRCRVCSLAATNADPELKARQLAAVREYSNRPEVRAASRERLAKYRENMPEADREKRRQRGYEQAATVLLSAEIRARSNSPEAKAKAGARRTETVLAWCPPPYRDLYRTLKKSQRYLAAEARALVEEAIAADKRRAKARPDTFERQMARIAAGAAVMDAPDFRTAGPQFTLGGIASASF